MWRHGRPWPLLSSLFLIAAPSPSFTSLSQRQPSFPHRFLSISVLICAAFLSAGGLAAWRCEVLGLAESGAELPVGLAKIGGALSIWVTFYSPCAGPRPRQALHIPAPLGIAPSCDAASTFLFAFTFRFFLYQPLRYVGTDTLFRVGKRS